MKRSRRVILQWIGTASIGAVSMGLAPRECHIRGTPDAPRLAEGGERADPSLYGRLDLSFGGPGPAKLLEYNADTPTSLFEAAVFQWIWLEQSIERAALPKGADQFNSIHECLIEAWREFD